MIFIFVTSPCTGVVVVVVGVVVFPFGKPSVGSNLWYWKPYTFLEFIIVIMLLPPQKPTATEPELFTPKKKDKKRNIIIHPPWFLGSILGSCFGETTIGQSICLAIIWSCSSWGERAPVLLLLRVFLVSERSLLHISYFELVDYSSFFVADESV